MDSGKSLERVFRQKEEPEQSPWTMGGAKRVFGQWDEPGQFLDSGRSLWRGFGQCEEPGECLRVFYIFLTLFCICLKNTHAYFQVYSDISPAS